MTRKKADDLTHRREKVVLVRKIQEIEVTLNLKSEKEGKKVENI